MGVTTATRAAPADAPPAIAPLQAIVFLGGIQVFTLLAAVARGKILALLLGPAGVGIAGVVDQVVSLVVQLGSLSIPFAALKFLSRSRDESPAALHAIYFALRKLLAGGALAAAGIAVALLIWRADIFGDGLASYRMVVVVALLGVPALAIGSMLRTVLAALGRFRDSALMTLATAVALAAASYIGVQWGGLVGLYLGNLIVALMGVIIAQWYLQHRAGLPLLSRGVKALRTARAEPGLSGFAGSLYVLSLTSPAAYLLSRSLVLDNQGAEAAGLLAAAYGIAVSLRLVLNQATNLCLMPLVNAKGSPEVRTAATSEYMRVLSVLFLLGAAVFVLFPREWIVLLYAPRFAPAAAFLAAFVLAEGILLLAGVYQSLLIGFDDVRGYLAATVSGHALTIALSIALVPAHGPLGVAIAFACGNGLILLGSACRLWSHHRATQALAPLGLVAISVAVVGGGGWLALTLPDGYVAIRCALYAAVAALFVARLSSSERHWLLSPLRMVTPERFRKVLNPRETET